jgi:phage FluMu protein Com
MVEPMAHHPHITTEAERFLHCAKCNAVAARAERLGRAVVYVRCGACGEAWTIAERRNTSRQNSRAARFPAAGA